MMILFLLIAINSAFRIMFSLIDCPFGWDVRFQMWCMFCGRCLAVVWSTWSLICLAGGPLCFPGSITCLPQSMQQTKTSSLAFSTAWRRPACSSFERPPRCSALLGRFWYFRNLAIFSTLHLYNYKNMDTKYNFSGLDERYLIFYSYRRLFCLSFHVCSFYVAFRSLRRPLTPI